MIYFFARLKKRTKLKFVTFARLQNYVYLNIHLLHKKSRTGRKKVSVRIPMKVVGRFLPESQGFKQILSRFFASMSVSINLHRFMSVCRQIKSNSNPIESPQSKPIFFFH